MPKMKGIFRCNKVVMIQFVLPKGVLHFMVIFVEVGRIQGSLPGAGAAMQQVQPAACQDHPTEGKEDEAVVEGGGGRPQLAQGGERPLSKLTFILDVASLGRSPFARSPCTLLLPPTFTKRRLLLKHHPSVYKLLQVGGGRS